MRTIKRDIAGAYIFSNDGHLLLGNNGPNGVYSDSWVIPGGGIEKGESKLKAVQREIMEEVGIDISNANPSLIDFPLTGTSTKTLKETGETVNVDMTFYNFRIDLPLASTEIPINLNDDFDSAEWVALDNLKGKRYSPSVEAMLRHLGYL
jgi:8-oxo-dGTP pyrophosphatase MutT (NUDIX family)